MNEEPLFLVCMRLADMRRVHPDQDNSRVCSQCAERVGVYPSGQQLLAKMPAVAIICQRCQVADPADVLIPAPGAIREALESITATKRKPH